MLRNNMFSIQQFDGLNKWFQKNSQRLDSLEIYLINLESGAYFLH